MLTVSYDMIYYLQWTLSTNVGLDLILSGIVWFEGLKMIRAYEDNIFNKCTYTVQHLAQQEPL